MTTRGQHDKRGGSRWGTKLALAWLAMVVLASFWAKLTGQGPIAWIETEYSLRTGSILGANILFLILILTLPSIWVLWGAVFRLEQAMGGQGEDSRRLLYRRYGIVLLVFTGGFVAMAVTGGVLAARAPDGRETAALLSPEDLARGAVPAGRVAIPGVRDIGAVVGFHESLRGGERYWLYGGFRPGAGAKGEDGRGEAPIALFLERSYNGRPEARAAEPETAEGYLIENGLPAYARIALERSGVRIASPHYLLRDGENGQRDTYFTMTLLGLLFAFMCGAIGGALMLIAMGVVPMARPPDG